MTEQTAEIAEIAVLSPVDELAHAPREHRAGNAPDHTNRFGQPESCDFWRCRILSKCGDERGGHPRGNPIALVLADGPADGPLASSQRRQMPPGRIETRQPPVGVEHGKPSAEM